MATIRGLKVPSLLIRMISEGRWQHPGDAAIRRIMPYMVDPLIFLTSLDVMERESRVAIADGGGPLRIHRGSTWPGEPGLPWLDIERAIFVAINQIPGDDVAVALDYRADSIVPRVVASDWTDNEYSWRVVAESFDEFVRELAM
jgi:hypothetical protein